MKLYMNWKTRTTHLTRDCHQIVTVPDNEPWLEEQEDIAVELVNRSRRYCSYCVARLLTAADREGVVPDADLHLPAFKADVYVADAARGGKLVRRERALSPMEGTELRVERHPDKDIEQRIQEAVAAGSNG